MHLATYALAVVSVLGASAYQGDEPPEQWGGYFEDWVRPLADVQHLLPHCVKACGEGQQYVDYHTACRPLELGLGPASDVDDIISFYALPAINEAAATAPVPSNYAIAFQGLQKATTRDDHLHVLKMRQYNVSECARLCDERVADCVSFNIYFQRAPSLVPAEKCRMPPSTTHIRCVFLDHHINEKDAILSEFKTLDFVKGYAGSNGYNKIMSEPESVSEAGHSEL